MDLFLSAWLKVWVIEIYLEYSAKNGLNARFAGHMNGIAALVFRNSLPKRSRNRRPAIERFAFELLS